MLSVTQSGLQTQWGPYDVSQAHGRVSLTELHSGWPQDAGIQVSGVEGGEWLGLINGHHGDTRRWKVPPTHAQTMKHMFCCSVYTYTLKGQESCTQSPCLRGQLHPWLNGTDFVCVVCDFLCVFFLWSYNSVMQQLHTRRHWHSSLGWMDTDARSNTAPLT